jgi:hypothetical protein
LVDEAVCIGPPALIHLKMSNIHCRNYKPDAIHPGYDYLKFKIFKDMQEHGIKSYWGSPGND